VDLDELVENPRYGREIKAEIMRRLEELDESYEEVAETVDLPVEVVRRVAGKHGFSEEERRIRKLEERYGELEKWRPVPGQPRYEISSYGRLIDTKTGEALEQEALWRSSAPRRTREELVAEAFISPKRAGMKVKHLDGDETNLFHKNLIWVPAERQAAGRLVLGLPRYLSDAERKRLIARVKEGVLYAEIAEEFGISTDGVSRIAREAGIGRDPLDTLTPAKLTQKDRIEIVKRAARGEKRAAIAHDLGVHRTTVRQTLRGMGVGPPDPKLTPEDRLEITRRAIAGEPYAEIAADFGISKSYASIVAEEEGAPKRRGMISEETKRAIAKSVAEGASLREAGAPYGMDYRNVARLLKSIEAGPKIRKLTPVDVRAIRTRSSHGESNASLARSFGVSETHIGRILRS
jgi:transposase-like protein